MDATLEALERRLDHSFRDRALLNRALTHRSRAFEESAAQAERAADNEQLEFLGDSILGFLVSEALLLRFPESAEGRLSKLKAYLVSTEHLHRVARELDLGAHLFLGRGEEMSGGRAKRALLANALEALIAALYLDAGVEAVRRFVVGRVVGDFDAVDGRAGQLVTDSKSALQEMAQSRKLPAPRYVTVGESGPEHHKTFVVEARLGPQWIARAEGNTKKRAGQRAAEELLRQLMSMDG